MSEHKEPKVYQVRPPEEAIGKLLAIADEHLNLLLFLREHLPEQIQAHATTLGFDLATRTSVIRQWLRQDTQPDDVE